MLKYFNVFFGQRVLNMPYNELRKDYLLNRWVVIATERSRRPTDFAKAESRSCPNRGLPDVCWQRTHDAARRDALS